jgi:hypothetical protein
MRFYPRPCFHASLFPCSSVFPVSRFSTPKALCPGFPRMSRFSPHCLLGLGRHRYAPWSSLFSLSSVAGEDVLGSLGSEKSIRSEKQEMAKIHLLSESFMRTHYTLRSGTVPAVSAGVEMGGDS